MLVTSRQLLEAVGYLLREADVLYCSLWSTVGERLLERLAWRQHCGRLVTHMVSPACLRLGGNS